MSAMGGVGYHCSVMTGSLLRSSALLPRASVLFGTALSVLACGAAAPAPSAPSGGGASAAPAPAPSEKEAVTAPAPTAEAPAAPATDRWPFGPEPTIEERAAQLERLKKDPGPIKTNWTPPGRGERYGHAEGWVPAPPDAVKAKLLDFGDYKALAGRKFKSVRVVDKQGQATDVYFQLPIMKGIVTLWYVTRFAPPRPAAGGGDVIEGTFVKGNIKGMHIAFTVRPSPEPNAAILTCDLLLAPGVPAPQSALDEELRDACGDAVNHLRRSLSEAAAK